MPLLIVYSLVNRPYLLDLQSDRSLIGALVARGHTVYLIDWGTPQAGDCTRTLADYIVGDLGACAQAVLGQTGAKSLDLLGVCQGGTFALCHAALEPARVRRLVTMVTPVDFATPDDALAAYAREIDLTRLLAACGNVPGELVRLAFLSLRPLANTLGKIVALAEAGDDRERVANHLRMQRWIADSPDQAGAAFAEFLDVFYRDNALVNGNLTLAGRPVHLRAVAMPVLNVYATRDHLVPPASSLALGTHVGSRAYRTRAFEGGHVGVFVSARARHEITDAVHGFLAARTP